MVVVVVVVGWGGQVSAHGDSALRVWDMVTRRCERVLEVYILRVRACAHAMTEG